MRFRNIGNWVKPDELKGLLYFAQRLDEMTFEYSLDSFRPPTTNVPFLIKEFLEALEAHEKLGLPLNSALHILDELEVRLRSNVVVSKLLSVRLDNYLKFGRENIDEMKRAFRVLGTELAPRSYLAKCFDLLTIAIVANDKRDIEFLSREMVTTLLNLGVSGFYINHLVVDHFFGRKPIETNSALESFLIQLSPKHHNFELVTKIRTPTNVLKKEILTIFHLSLSSKIPKRFLDCCPEEMKKLSAGEKYLIATDVTAFDRFAAVEITKEKVARMHNLYGLFYHKGSHSLDDNAVVIQSCCLEEKCLVNTQVNRMHFVDDNKPADAATKLFNMIKTLQLPSGPDREKFFRIIDFHGLSAKSDTVDNQIITLWTSLETLVPAKNSGSIISGVTYGVLPFIGLGYIQRLFERVTFDILRWNRRELTKVLKKTVFPSDSNIVEKVFCLVVLKENEEVLSDFLGRLLNFELLRYRIFALNSAYSTPEKITKNLDAHQRRVEWQLHRIYRTRNAIVHSGTTPKYAPLLVSNAHDYFDQVFSTVSILSSHHDGFDNFVDCFDFGDRLFSQYRSDIAKMTSITSDSAASILWTPSSKHSNE